MKSETFKKKETSESCGMYGMSGIMHPMVGKLAKSEHPGVILVQYNGLEPKPARILAGLERHELSKKENIGRDVLIIFEGGNPEYPIIIGLLESLLDDLVSMENPCLVSTETQQEIFKETQQELFKETQQELSMEIEQDQSKTSEPLETLIDDKRIVLEAQDEIVLKCGKGSITLNKDGKIIVKGTNLISRASETNKIKGSSIDLN